MSSLWSVGDNQEHARAIKVMGTESPTRVQRNRPEDLPRDVLAASAVANLLGVLGSFSRLVRVAQVSQKQLQVSAALVLLGTIISAFLAVVLTMPAILLLIPFFFLSVVWWLRQKGVSRAQMFERDYPALLLALASSVRTGLDPLVAMHRAISLFPKSSEVRNELIQFAAAIDQGWTEERAIRQFGGSIDHPDIKLFRTAFLLARKEGSALSACLHRLAKVTRNRQSFRRKIKTAIAMQKLSSLGIAGCAVVIMSIQAAMNYEALKDAVSHPTGARMLGAGALLMICGLGMMLRMSRVRI